MAENESMDRKIIEALAKIYFEHIIEQNYQDAVGETGMQLVKSKWENMAEEDKEYWRQEVLVVVRALPMVIDGKCLAIYDGNYFYICGQAKTFPQYARNGDILTRKEIVEAGYTHPIVVLLGEEKSEPQ